jgi:DNA-directed RNA polymerase specialized sigma24 family protein
MTDKQKKAMQLKLEGYSLTETAAIMGTSVPNVKKHLDKAIEFLKNNF